MKTFRDYLEDTQGLVVEAQGDYVIRGIKEFNGKLNPPVGMDNILYFDKNKLNIDAIKDLLLKQKVKFDGVAVEQIGSNFIEIYRIVDGELKQEK